jgi:methylmalonyl-CoA/ethylmalonyl-CoA epimerase
MTHLPPVEDAKFDHVAHVAPRIRDLLPLYVDVLGGRFTHGTVNRPLGYRLLHLAFADATKIELMEPTGPGSFLEGFLRRNPTGGLHHITYRVTDLLETVRRAEAAGCAVFAVDVSNPDWKEAFVHPRSGHGVLVQFAQAAADWPRMPDGTTLETVLGTPD